MNSNSTHFAAVSNSRFEDNTGDGIYFYNSSSFTLNKNYFRTYDAGSNGLYLNHCRFFTVKNNTFEEDNNTQQNTGMYIYDSQKGLHQVYRNNFAGFKSAINAVDNNSGYGNNTNGLLMNCNDFTPSANEFDIAMLGNGIGLNAPTVMRTQGEINFFGPVVPNKLVRNIYSATCNNQSKWFAAGAGTNTLVIKHGSNSSVGSNTAAVRPLPQPACSNTIVTVFNSGTPLDYTLHCPENLLSQGGDGPIRTKLDIINAELTAQRTLGEDADITEIQSALAAKINLFYMDSLDNGIDSVIATLTDNYTYIDDADLQMVFAFISKEDYVTASSLNDELDADRDDWKALISALIEIYQETDGIYSIRSNSNTRELIEAYAETDGIDGQGLATSLLNFVMGTVFTEPRPLPGNEEDGRMAQPSSVNTVSHDEPTVKIYPNPARNAVNVQYENEIEGVVLLEIHDVLGKSVYLAPLVKGTNNVVSLNNYTNGIYIITITRGKELLYKSKLVKQE